MTTLNGLPAHVLLVHAIVVLLPLAALLLVLTVAWPPARRRLAGPNALLSSGVLILVPITTDAGEWLERRVPSTVLLHEHTELGDTALFAAVPVTVLALVVWWRGREETAVAASGAAELGGAPRSGGSTATLTRPAPSRRVLLAPASKATTIVIAVLAVLAAGAAAYDVYRIGDSGAKASWTGNFSSTPTDTGPGRTGGK